MYANTTRMNTSTSARAMIQPNSSRNTIHPITKMTAVTGPALWGLYHDPLGSVWNSFQQQPWWTSAGGRQIVSGAQGMSETTLCLYQGLMRFFFVVGGGHCSASTLCPCNEHFMVYSYFSQPLKYSTREAIKGFSIDNAMNLIMKNFLVKAIKSQVFCP